MTKRILIVEDFDDLRDAMSIMFELLGYDVVLATDGREAVAVAGGQGAGHGSGEGGAGAGGADVVAVEGGGTERDLQAGDGVGGSVLGVVAGGADPDVAR